MVAISVLASAVLSMRWVSSSLSADCTSTVASTPASRSAGHNSSNPMGRLSGASSAVNQSYRARVGSRTCWCASMIVMRFALNAWRRVGPCGPQHSLTNSQPDGSAVDPTTASPSRSQTDVVVDGSKRMITSGALGAGSRLPIEKYLAGELGVSRRSLREGCAPWCIMGVLEARSSEVTYVTSLERASSTPMMHQGAHPSRRERRETPSSPARYFSIGRRDPAPSAPLLIIRLLPSTTTSVWDREGDAVVGSTALPSG